MSSTTSRANPPAKSLEPSSLGDRDAWTLQLREIASGNESALTALYASTSHKVYGCALYVTRIPGCAAEVTVDVYLQVWRNARSYDPNLGSVLTWLLTICRNRAIDVLRRRDPASLSDDPYSLAQQEPVDANGPDALLLQSERKRCVNLALASLAPVPRQMLALAYYRGLTQQEIAVHSGLPLGTVKAHIRRALQSLKTAVELRDEAQTRANAG